MNSTFVTTLKKPLTLSLLGHLTLFLLFLIELPQTHFGYKTSTPVRIVTATAVSERQVQHQVHRIQAKARQKRLQALRRKRQLEAQRLARVKAAKAKKMAALKREKVLALKKKQAVLEKKKEALMQKMQAMALAKEKKEHANKLKMLQEQLALKQEKAEQARISAEREHQILGVLDQYKSKILQAIGQNWLIPAGIDHHLSCQLLIHLAPNGAVLGVDLLKSSGNDALDRSAKTAILKASPLPVPTSATLFDRFRELRLTVRPEEIVS